MPSKNSNGSDSVAAALAEVSDRLARLVQDEIELAKTEVAQKASSLARGAAAVAAGAVFGIFAVVFFLLTLAWVFDGIFVSGAGSLWLGFLIVLIILSALTVGAFLFAWKKLKVGAPTPSMAISEGKKIKDTVTSFGAAPTNGTRPASADAFASVISPALSAAAASAPTPPAPVVADPEPASSALPEPAIWTSESTAVEPVVAPAPVEPAPVEPAAVEPTPVVPAPAEPVIQPEPAVDLDPPTFVSVPEPAEEPPAAETPAPEAPASEPEYPATEEAPTTPPVYDPPALLSDRPSAAADEPVYGVEPVPADEDTDSPSTGPEN